MSAEVSVHLRPESEEQPDVGLEQTGRGVARALLGRQTGLRRPARLLPGYKLLCERLRGRARSLLRDKAWERRNRPDCGEQIWEE